MCISKFYCWNNRNGNHLLSYLNLVKYAFLFGNNHSIQIPGHGLFDLKTQNLETGTEICRCNKVTDLTRQINPCGGGRRLRFAELRPLVQKYIKPKFTVPTAPTYDICMHLRDGDIFANLIHFEYVQPSLDYYIKVIEQNPHAKICILYTHGNSPYLPLIKKYLNDYKLTYKVTFQHGTLEEDLATLCSCKTLIWSFGTFCLIPSMFSNSIETVVMPESIFRRTRGNPWFDENNEKEYKENCVPSLRVIKHPDYIPTGYWKNTPEQIEKMCTYKLPETELAKLRF